jgi:uncharacterized membrane protein
VRIVNFGDAVFAVTMIALGIVGLIQGRFTATWSGVPRGMPHREGLAYLCALISLVCGAGLLWHRTAMVAIRALLVSFLIWMAAFRVSHFFAAPTGVDTWWGCADTAVMVAAAWALYARFASNDGTQHRRFAGGDNGLRVARVFFALALIPFGVAHFTNLKETTVLIPGWLPWHVSWAYFTGSAFIAAGVAVLVGVCARLAATLITLQLGLFTLIVWLPVVASGAATAPQWTEFVTSWVLTTAAWVVADSYRGMPWLAVTTPRFPLVTTEAVR